MELEMKSFLTVSDHGLIHDSTWNKAKWPNLKDIVVGLFPGIASMLSSHLQISFIGMILKFRNILLEFLFYSFHNNNHELKTLWAERMVINKMILEEDIISEISKRQQKHSGDGLAPAK